ncbi:MULTISPECIES: helix-turn-helix domain-containing protein [Streptomyces griseus group]|jgi:DNA-binding Xre family transcriptional regulator|uniref:helix-turn-helix domain-containing protein n=1 Tax=Streptomyces griseus group TaxID=629295 RepID=UPI0033A1D0E6
MKWNLRMVAAQRDLWRPTEVLAAFRQVGFNPSLSKVAALWGGTPVTVRLEDLDLMCAALGCTVADLLQAEPLAGTQAVPEEGERTADGAELPSGPVRPVPGSRRGSGPRSLPPS